MCQSYRRREGYEVGNKCCLLNVVNQKPCRGHIIHGVEAISIKYVEFSDLKKVEVF